MNESYIKLLYRLRGWEPEILRRKDYVLKPKPSGYQSLHMSLIHKESNACLEIQVRTRRMHWIAEHGAASHSNYKALLLPPARS